MKLPYPYQEFAIRSAADWLRCYRGYGLILGMGLGKTGSTLKTIDYLHLVEGIEKVLITAPSRVLKHWYRERKDWNTALPVHVINGNEANRLPIIEQGKPGIYVISHAMLDWLSKLGLHWDKFVVDEGSKFRNWSAQRTIAARRLSSLSTYRMILTGTPVPKSSADIFAQQWILDHGQTLGRNITAFRDKFCYRGGHENREWLVNPQLTGYIAQLVAPWYLHQATMDHLQMPQLIEREIEIDLPAHTIKAYKHFEKEMYAEFDTNPVMALSASSKYAICRQLASGGVYVDGVPVGIHNAKIDAIKDIIDETGRPILIAYQYTHELDKLVQAFPHAEFIRGGTSAAKTEDIISRWKSGVTRILICQSETISHGVDGLQHGGCDLVWYTLTNDCETFEQLITRLWRQGQQGPAVTIHYLLAKRTIDFRVLAAIRAKARSQAEFLEILKSRNPQLVAAGSAPFPFTLNPSLQGNVNYAGQYATIK